MHCSSGRGLKPTAASRILFTRQLDKICGCSWLRLAASYRGAITDDFAGAGHPLTDHAATAALHACTAPDTPNETRCVGQRNSVAADACMVSVLRSFREDLAVSNVKHATMHGSAAGIQHNLRSHKHVCEFRLYITPLVSQR